MGDQDSTASRVRALEQRVQWLESSLLRAWCGLVAAGLLAGVLVPYGYEGSDDERVTWSVLTTPFVALNGGADSGDGGEELTLAVLFLVGFIRLVLVILGLLGGLLVIGGRNAGTRAPRFLRVLLILAVIGSVVVLLIAGMISGLDRGEGGPGGFVLLAALLAYLPLLTGRGRALWAGRS